MPRAAAAATLLLLGLLALATTQPWVAGVVEAAPGSVRTRWSATGAELVPWVPAASLAAGAATLVLLTRTTGRVVRPVDRLLGVLSTAGCLTALAGALLVVAGGTGVPTDVVVAAPTGWSWTALLAAAAATTAALPSTVVPTGRSSVPPPVGPGPARSDRRSPGDDVPAERQRWQVARTWTELDAGRDPTSEPGAGTMAPAAPQEHPQDDVPGEDVEPDGPAPGHHETDR
ncbi:hypothetical protein ACQE98_10980 [Ornithinimicrobium sp. W1679]|uniref:hypothetical protein n=1 Tax=Ornithinimicrobium sp. W1679 TaxID=3418770 RepID=UPI003CE9CE43